MLLEYYTPFTRRSWLDERSTSWFEELAISDIHEFHPASFIV